MYEVIRTRHSVSHTHQKPDYKRVASPSCLLTCRRSDPKTWELHRSVCTSGPPPASPSSYTAPRSSADAPFHLWAGHNVQPRPGGGVWRAVQLPTRRGACSVTAAVTAAYGVTRSRDGHCDGTKDVTVRGTTANGIQRKSGQVWGFWEVPERLLFQSSPIN